MRAQFNKTGASRLPPDPASQRPAGGHHQRPQNQGTLLESGRGVVFADVDISWWSAQIQNLETSGRPDAPSDLPDNNNVLLHSKDLLNCCVIGYHGTRAAGLGGGSTNSTATPRCRPSRGRRGSSPASTRANGGTDWALQDIHALSHEIAEWADDPFVNNTVQPWLTPTAPQYGCTGILETGDPVVAIGFAMGTTPSSRTQPERIPERRRLLPPGGRGVSPVVHAHGAEHRSEPTQTRR